MHDPVTPGSPCPGNSVVDMDICFPTATSGFCPGPGAPCTQDTRGHLPLVCPEPRYTCQVASDCDSTTGCTIVTLDARCPPTPLGAYPCSQFICDPTHPDAVDTSHGCRLTPLLEEGDECQHWDSCRIDTVCQSNMICGGGTTVRCPDTDESGYLQLCVSGKCVVSIIHSDDDDDLYQTSESPSTISWLVPMASLYSSVVFVVILGILLGAILLITARWYLYSEVEVET